MLQTDSIGRFWRTLRPITRPAYWARLIHMRSHRSGPNRPGFGRQFYRNRRRKGCSDAQRKIDEVNMSTYVFDCQLLLAALDKLTDDNRQKEYYITDVPGILLKEGRDVRALSRTETHRSPQRQHRRTPGRCRKRQLKRIRTTDA